MAEIERDEISGTDTTGHQWDGIKELNTPLPRWWLWTFYATIVWAIGYCIAYPAWPMLTGVTQGVLGYSSRSDVAQELAKAKEAQGALREKIRTSSLEQIKADKDLFAFAVAGGKSAFTVNCVQCHGSGATGSKGYPNLNDDDWLWGGKIEDIYKTIAHGIRFEENAKTRISAMPAFGRDGVLNAEQISDVAEYVLSLSGRQTTLTAVEKGMAIYKEQCVACHKEGGAGDREQGAPSLKDAIWLYGTDKRTIVETITNSRKGVMPAWSHRLDDETIKKLSVYVHSLGGGE